VTSSANPSVFADPVTFTIAVTAPTSTAPVPTGTVTATLFRAWFSWEKALWTAPAKP
jgi:hypothetical protein